VGNHKQRSNRLSKLRNEWPHGAFDCR
jgi:hypothetical protein